MLRTRNTKKLSDKKLRKFLFTLNFNVYSDGTTYLIDAINIAYQNPYLLSKIKDIYSIISIKYSISEESVKWSIRNSIEAMNRNTSNKEINKILSINRYRKVTPKYFIPLVISHFEL